MATQSRQIGSALIAMGTAVVGIAGLAKLLNLPQFMDSLSSWTVLPVASHLTLTLSVPIVEAGVGIAWCLKSPLARSGWPAILIVLTLTSVLLVQVSVGPVPECHCFGQIMQFHEEMQSARWMLARNTALMGMLAAGMVLIRNPQSRSIEGTGQVY